MQACALKKPHPLIQQKGTGRLIDAKHRIPVYSTDKKDDSGTVTDVTQSFRALTERCMSCRDIIKKRASAPPPKGSRRLRQECDI